MPRTRDQQQVEVAVGLHQGVHHLQRRGRVDVPVEFSHHQQQLSGESVCLRHVRLLGIVRAQRVTHPLLVPPHLVDPVVVAAAVGHRHPVEIAVPQQRPQGVLPPGGPAVNADPRQVKFGKLLRGPFSQAMRSGKPASARFFQQTS